MSKEQQQRLFDGITNIRDDLVEKAQEGKLKAARPAWRRWVAIAASLTLVIGLGGIWLWQQSASSPSTEGGNGGPADGAPFMSYAGPVFPLTLVEQQDGMTASRSLSFDFTARKDENDRTLAGAQVQDAYVLSNHSDKALTVTALYPFAGSFKDLSSLLPTISVDEQPVQAALYAGAYSGGFTGVGPDDPYQSVNLKRLETWEGYKALLENGAYQQQALSPYPKLDQKVTVYEFSDYKAPLDEYDAATQAISFEIDPAKTTILQYGFEGLAWDENGYRQYSYFVPNGVSMRSEVKMLIVIGEDIGEYTLQGYEDGGCDAGEELDDVSASITRYDAVLSDVIDRLTTEYFSHYGPDAQKNDGTLEGVSREMFLGAAAQLLYELGPLSQTGVERYEDGRLMDILWEAYVHDRVLYLAFPVTIPAGESVNISVELYKDPSFDFAGAGSEKEGLQGYELVTTLGSNLRFEAQTAEVLGTDNIEIIRQNFGFDLQNGITQVSLEPAAERYYIDVRRAAQDE